MTHLTGVSPADIRKGDRLVTLEDGAIWTALADATVTQREVLVPVKYHPDGGRDTRVWDLTYPDKLPILRDGEPERQSHADHS